LQKYTLLSSSTQNLVSIYEQNWEIVSRNVNIAWMIYLKEPLKSV